MCYDLQPVKGAKNTFALSSASRRNILHKYLACKSIYKNVKILESFRNVNQKKQNTIIFQNC